MPDYRIIPALALAVALPLAVWAQAPTATLAPQADAPPTPPTEAEETIDQAIKTLQTLDTVSAELTQSVNLLNQKFQITGRYLKAPNHRSLTTLDLKGPAGTSAKMAQVSDGTTLWDYSLILDTQSARKLQLEPVLKKLQSPEIDDELRERVLGGLGFGGPDALLVGLRRAMSFDQKVAGTLDGTPEGKKVWILRGRWKDYDALTLPGQPAFLPTAPLPTYVPSNGAIYLGQDDGWPYRVELKGRVLSVMEQAKRDDRPLGPDGKPIGPKTRARQQEDPSQIILVYSDVNLDAKLTEADFAFQPPPDVTPADSTSQILAGLDAAIMERVAQKRAEAATKGTEAAIPAIPVPPPPGDNLPAPDQFRSTAPPPR
jgi:outer membrane lipoprotein-sorting protein